MPAAEAAVTATAIPKAYYALFGASIGTGLLTSQGPLVYRSAHSRYYRWKYYWKRFAYSTNPELNVSILAYVLQHQDEITGSSQICKFSYKEKGDNKTVVMKLPQFNKNYKFKTRWGIIYIRLITLDGLTIAGFELAVMKRDYSSLWCKQKKKINLLNYYIQRLCEQVNLNYVGDDTAEPKIIKKYDEEIKKKKAEKEKAEKEKAEKEKAKKAETEKEKAEKAEAEKAEDGNNETTV